MEKILLLGSNIKTEIYIDYVIIAKFRMGKYEVWKLNLFGVDCVLTIVMVIWSLAQWENGFVFCTAHSCVCRNSKWKSTLVHAIVTNWGVRHH